MLSLKCRHIGSLVRRWATALLVVFDGLLLSAPTTLLYAQTSDSLSITITPKDSYPPETITDLNATSGGVGQMLLQWTAPDADDNKLITRSAASSYIVRIATLSVSNLSNNTTAWWNLAQDVTGEPPPSTPGTSESLLLNGITGGVTWYAGIRSVDAAGNISDIDVNARSPGQQAGTFVYKSGAPTTPVNFFGLALSTSSIQWSWDSTPNATFHVLTDYVTGNTIAQSNVFVYTETGLPPNKALTRRLAAGNSSGLSSPTLAQTIYTFAQTPSDVAFVQVIHNTIRIQWNASGNPNATSYRVERSLDNVNYSVLGFVTNTSYADTGLTQLTNYSYRVRAVNGDGIATAYSTVISTQTPELTDLLAPQTPLGLKAIVDPSGRVFTLNWEKVTANEDGTSITDLAGYNIYKRNDLTSSPTKMTPQPLTVTAFADQVDNRTYYYTVRAVDLVGNQSPESLFADSSPDANVIFLNSDSVSQVIMPQSVNDLLRSDYNKYGVPLTVHLDEEPIPSNTSIVRQVRVYLVRPDTKEEVKDLAFVKPLTIVAIGYNDVNGQVGRGAPNSSSTSDSATSATPDQLSIYWHNGVTWVKVGGTTNRLSQTIQTKSSFLGTYQLRVAAQATSLALDQANVFPRVFTPNGDGLNDRVYFVLENPKNASVTGEILDLSGRHIANLAPPTENGGIGTTLVWDGRDSNGGRVPGGLYYYKIQGEGKTFSGTVAVAR